MCELGPGGFLLRYLLFTHTWLITSYCWWCWIVLNCMGWIFAIWKTSATSKI